MRVLVTGGAGFIGSHLVRACLEAGARVRVLDDFSTGRRDRLSGVAGEVEILEGSVADPEAVARATRGCEVVHHLAALPSVQLSVEDPVRTHVANATGTLAVLDAARKLGVRRVVYASSCSVYGNPARTPIAEDSSPAPLSPYALQKYVGELYAERFLGLYGLEVVTLRYFNVYGPGQDADSAYAAVVPRFVTALLKGEPPQIFGDGKQSRDFVYVKDVVAANLAAARAPSSVAGARLNVGTGAACSVSELLSTVARVLDRDGVRPEHRPARPGEARHAVADVTRAASVLAWKARTSLEAGIAATARALREGDPA